MIEVTTYKNYKELCVAMGWNVAGGNAKVKQLKMLESLCKYHKEGNKFFIDEIYAEPKLMVDGRSNGNNSVYVSELKPIVLDMLTRLYKRGELDICLTTSALLKNIYGGNNPLIKEYLRIDGIDDVSETVLLDLVTSKRNKLWSSVNGILNNFRKDGYIRIQKGRMRVKLKDGNYIWADTEMINKIETIRRDILDKLTEEKGYSINLINLKRYGLKNRFNKELAKRLEELGGIYKDINYAFDATQIILTDQFIVKLLERKELLERLENYYEIAENRDRESLNKKAVKYSQLPRFIEDKLVEEYIRTNGISIKGSITCSSINNKIITYAEPTEEQKRDYLSKDKEYLEVKDKEVFYRQMTYIGAMEELFERLNKWLETNIDEIDNVYGKIVN